MTCGPNHIHQALSVQCPSSPPDTALCIPLSSRTWLTCLLPTQKQIHAFFLTRSLQVAALLTLCSLHSSTELAPPLKAYNCGHLCSYRPASLDQVSIPHYLYSSSQTPKIPSLICHPPWKGIFHEIKEKSREWPLVNPTHTRTQKSRHHSWGKGGREREMEEGRNEQRKLSASNILTQLWKKHWA